MRLLPLLRLTARAMWRRNPRRTLLTIFAVASATVVFSTVMTVPYLMDRIAHLANRSPRVVVMNRYAARFGLQPGTPPGSSAFRGLWGSIA